MSGKCRILTIMIMTVLCLGNLSAQPKTVGISFCFSGIGVEYGHQVDMNSFAEFQLKAETTHVFTSFAPYPGFSGSVFWNVIFARHLSRNGNEIRLYAGPGLSAGFSRDILTLEGPFFGLRGRIGGECTFSRGVALRVSLSPMIGMHLRSENKMMGMRLYKTGLLYSIMPEIGISYPF